MSVGGASAALSGVLQATLSTIDWAANEIDTPYKEQFSKIHATAKNKQWLDDQLSGVKRTENLPEEFVQSLSAAKAAYDSFESITDVVSVAEDIFTAYQNSSNVKTALDQGALSGSANALSFFKTTAITEVEQTLTQIIEIYAKIVTMAKAAYSIRIPYLQEIVDLQQQAEIGELSPVQIIALQHYKAYQYYVMAAAASGIKYYQQQIATIGPDGVLGDAYSTIYSIPETSDHLEQSAENYRILGNLALEMIHAYWEGAQQTFESSINREMFDEEVTWYA
jgi:tetratricopeptide (TPR) repeat protein